jgi:hypothetical protein
MFPMRFLFTALGVFVLNLPFGYWRASEQKFSSRWFLSVHAPVPFVVALRLLSGLGWQLITFPLMFGAFFGGQLFGARIFHQRKMHLSSTATSCLIWDMVRDFSGGNRDGN